MYDIVYTRIYVMRMGWKGWQPWQKLNDFIYFSFLFHSATMFISILQSVILDCHLFLG